MKFNKSRQLLLVSAVSLLTAGLMTACGTLTTDFVFVATKAAAANNYGEIDVFEINAVSGVMRQIPTSPFLSEGREPVAEAVSPDNTNLYVVNQYDNTIVQFLIGSDGKLYPQNTVNTPGTYPLAVAANGSNLFVVDTYQPLSNCSIAEPCSGSIAVFPLLTAAQAKALTPPEIADTLGPVVVNPGSSSGATYWPLTLPSSPTDVLVPTAINVVKSGAYLYVTAYDASVTPNRGYIFGFSVGTGGVLTPLNGGVPHNMGVGSKGLGIHPSAIASDSTSTYVYVTDSTNGIVVSYSTASGLLTKISDTPTGNQPSAIAVDSTYAYVANTVDGNVSAYSIGNGGALTFLGTYATGIQPVAIGIDPSTNHFVFTANFLGNGAYSTISDFEMDTTTGTLINTQHSPYRASAEPTAVVAVPHKTTQQ